MFKKISFQKKTLFFFVCLSMSFIFLTSKSKNHMEKKIHKTQNFVNNSIFVEEFLRIKNSVYNTYQTLKMPIEICKNKLNTNQSSTIIDVNKTLEQLGLDGLVEFYSNASLKYNMDIRNLNYSKPKNIENLDFLELWNSKDINLLNESISNNWTSLIDYKGIELGGHWKPKDCKSQFKIAVIIPFRDRLPQLKVITHYLHMFLQRQLLDYRIFVVEPKIQDNTSFNKGRVMNSAYLEAIKVDNYDCIIFHDVDLLPEDERNIYSCSSRPKHLSVAIDKFEYKLPYKTLVGGVLSIQASQYKLVNGYSNSFWGWGGEGN